MIHAAMACRASLLGLAAIVALLVARPADACSSQSLSRGLTVREPPQERRIAGDGVLAFDAFVRGESPELALARFTLTLTPDAGGPAIEGETSLRIRGSAPYSQIEDYQAIVLVWRPDAPPGPGAYTAVATVVDDDFGPREWSFPVVVDAAAGPSLSAPQVEDARAQEFDDEALERVCCEVSQDSCGGNSFCEPTRVRVVPGFQVRARLAPADLERAYLWVAPWDGEAAGPPYARVDPWYGTPFDAPWWSEWGTDHPIRLPDAGGERCIVVGATSLMDGSVALAPPVCEELTAAYEDPRTPTFPASDDSFGRQCLTPPVYEHDGSPYPPEPDRGCRMAERSGAPFVLLLLAIRRRRRVAST